MQHGAERFPDLPIAVVTHGDDQFALLSQYASGPLEVVHGQVQRIGEERIDLHVCGAYALMQGHSAEEFPEYFDVAASGPAQPNDYARLGYRGGAAEAQ